MPVSSLLERMRKKLQEKAAAAGNTANKDGTNDASSSITTGNNQHSNSATGTGAENGPSSSSSTSNKGLAGANSVASSSSVAAQRSEPAVPLPPPVFASPSSARLDYRDVRTDPLCVPFTADMAVTIVERLLETAAGDSSAQQAPTATLASAFSAPAMDNHGGSSSDIIRGGGGPIVQGSALVVETAVQHLRETIAGASTDTITDAREQIATQGSTSRGQLPHTTAASSAASGSLFDDAVYRVACAQSRIEVSGAARPMCRDVNFYTRVGRISQGVYGVVFKAVAASADAELPSGAAGLALDNEDTTGVAADPAPTSNGSETPTAPPRQDVPRKAYALKHIKKVWLEESQIGFPPYLLREIDLLLRLKHPNIMGARELVLLDPTPVPPPLSASAQAGVDGHAAHDGTLPPPRRRPREDGGSIDTGGFDDASPPLQQPKREAVAALDSTSHSSALKGSYAHSGGNSAAIEARPLAAVGAVSETKDVFLVMDFCPVDLTTYMRRYHTTPTCQIPFFHITSRNTHPAASANYLARAKSIAYQLFRAVAFLHANRVLHRDLKTSNVLLGDDGYVKVCDFGLGRLYREGQGLTPTVVTLMYRAPELHLGVVDYSHKMDVWSLGCILAELFLRRPLFHAATDSHHLLAVCDVLGIPTEETFPGLYHLPQTKVMMQSLPRWNRVSKLAELFKPGATMFTPSHGDVAVAPEATLLPPEGLELLTSILQWNPRRRPSAAEVLRHPFFHTAPLPCAPAELMRPMPWREAAGSTGGAAQLRPPPPAVRVAAAAAGTAPADTSAPTASAVESTVEAQAKSAVLTRAPNTTSAAECGGSALEEANTLAGRLARSTESPTASMTHALPNGNPARQGGGVLATESSAFEGSPGRAPGHVPQSMLDVEDDIEAERAVRLAQIQANRDAEETEAGRKL